MAVFSYKGYTVEGKETKGVIEAPNKSVAIRELKRQNIFPYEVQEKSTSASKKELKLFFLRKTPISNEELALFFRTLGIMLNAGIPILDAINSLSKEAESEKLKAFYLEIASGLKEGLTLTESIKKAGIRDPVLINLIHSGEKSGYLSSNLLIAAEILEKREKLKNKVVQALAYPTILITIAFSVVVFMLVTVVPKIVNIYKSTGAELPTVTKFTIAMSNLFINHYVILLLSTLLLTLLLYYFAKKKPLTIDKWKLKLGVLGKIILFSELQRFFSTMAILLKSGAPLIESVNISIQALKNTYVKNKLQKIPVLLNSGHSLSPSLSQTSVLPGFILQLLKAGEESGELPQMLERIDLILTEEIERKTQYLTSLLEPVTMLLAGFIVGFIIYSLLLPIVSISVIKGIR
ncbi:type II secretion system protein F (GspF) [Desulfurobacterium pacificum]|uniref:General secretion pathway protein F n=1 Tax=Desulfurobacterium pacificum TaxID=240166 RepID=A0ABY1NAQ2_9BACT|nr:type II secretion system F family protein [Desulfurobacterium pacificum]SMP04598.1 type II secretion system protein F (GspF) [Desulfurobacterium pacificum]